MLSNRFLVKNIKNNSLRGCVIFEKKVKILKFLKLKDSSRIGGEFFLKKVGQ